MAIPKSLNRYAAFLAVFAAACLVLFAFFFAANSCRIFAPIASLSTLYAVVASLRMAGLPREAASRMLDSTIRRESVPSSARRMNSATVLKVDIRVVAPEKSIVPWA